MGRSCAGLLIFAIAILVFQLPTSRAVYVGLTWEAPTTQADGTPLTNLAGYRVYSSPDTIQSPCPGTFSWFVPASNPVPGPETLVTFFLTGLTPESSYTFSVSAVDAGGNEGGCSQTATGPAKRDTVPPSVEIGFPSNNFVVMGSGIHISAGATDDIGIVSVQFKVDGTPIGEVSRAPYFMFWNTTPTESGSHYVTAIARDAEGNTTESSMVFISVWHCHTTAP